jgi:hypothetical protein
MKTLVETVDNKQRKYIHKFLGDCNMFDEWQIEYAENFKEAQNFYENREEEKKSCVEIRWIYRGQKFLHKNGKTNEPELKTSLDRAFENFDINGEDRIRREGDIIREFQRKLHLHVNQTPAKKDFLGWLALMQHHGAPTRLLDWTYSFWVALYFAINNLRPGDEGEVWALDTLWFSRTAEDKLKIDMKNHIERTIEEIKSQYDTAYLDETAIRHNAYVHYLFNNPINLVYNVNPFRMNERLTIQQGVFLLQGDITKPFLQNLKSYIYDGKVYKRVRILRINYDNRNEILREVLRMNINNAVLFPGLDGFADSLRTRLVFPFNELRAVPTNDL